MVIYSKNACKLEFTDHLWLPFLYQLKVRCCIFEIINFQIYKIHIKWKYMVGPNDKMTFNEELENISTSIIKLANIDESSHKEAIVIFITKKDFKNQKKLSYRGWQWKLL